MPNTLRLKTILFLLRLHERLFHPNFDSVFTRLFSHLSTVDMVIFDIGAHRGESIRAFSDLLPGAKVHAFEPDVDNYDKLYTDWGDSENVRLNNFGIGDESTEREFYHHLLTTTSTFKQTNTNSEWVKLKSKLLNVKPEKLVNKSYTVQVKTLDDYVRDNHIEHIHILKFDTEGFELECLKGAEKILNAKKVDAIQIEGNNSDAYQESTPYDKLSDLIEGYGYICYKEKHRFLNRDLIDAVFIRQDLLKV